MFLKRRVGAASTSQRPKDPSVMCVTLTGASEISLSLVCLVLFLILLNVNLTVTLFAFNPYDL